MGLFNRKPGERVAIRDYLRATDAVSRPLAILLTLIVLIVTAAIIFGLFLGGRWLYNRITDNNDGAPATVQNDSPSQPTTTVTPTVTTSPTSTPSPTPTALPTTTPTPASQMPNTGPEPE